MSAKFRLVKPLINQRPERDGQHILVSQHADNLCDKISWHISLVYMLLQLLVLIIIYTMGQEQNMSCILCNLLCVGFVLSDTKAAHHFPPLGNISIFLQYKQKGIINITLNVDILIPQSKKNQCCLIFKDSKVQLCHGTTPGMKLYVKKEIITNIS